MFGIPLFQLRLIAKRQFYELKWRYYGVRFCSKGHCSCCASVESGISWFSICHTPFVDVGMFAHMSGSALLGFIW